MRTVQDGLKEAIARKAYIMRGAYEAAVKDGYGGHPFTVYAGPAFSGHYDSTRQRTRRHWEALGYSVVNEYRGARAGRDAEAGHVVVMVLSPPLTC